jgi:gliding motility-associated lipoprotein GldD
MMQKLVLLLFVCFFTACTDEVLVPKPRAYPRVLYPKTGETQDFNTDFCKFSCKIPAYAKIEKDETFFDAKPADECWFNVVVPDLNAKIYCSYYPIKSRKDFDGLVRDAYEMVNKHNIKASYINEAVVHRTEANVHGVVFDIEGPVASTYQFFLTDSTRHFLRGALYFETQARPDSLAPVVNFMKNDVNAIVSSLKWK